MFSHVHKYYQFTAYPLPYHTVINVQFALMVQLLGSYIRANQLMYGAQPHSHAHVPSLTSSATGGGSHLTMTMHPSATGTAQCLILISALVTLQVPFISYLWK